MMLGKDGQSDKIKYICALYKQGALTSTEARERLGSESNFSYGDLSMIIEAGLMRISEARTIMGLETAVEKITPTRYARPVQAGDIRMYGCGNIPE